MRKTFHVWTESKNPSFRTQLNGVQRLLVDILRFNTGKIKVFNTNLFIENKINPNYRINFNSDTFCWHDIISNFNFTKILWKNGLFEADEVLAKVLSMTEEEYAMAMAERYEV